MLVSLWFCAHLVCFMCDACLVTFMESIEFCGLTPSVALPSLTIVVCSPDHSANVSNMTATPMSCEKAEKDRLVLKVFTVDSTILELVSSFDLVSMETFYLIVQHIHTTSSGPSHPSGPSCCYSYIFTTTSPPHTLHINVSHDSPSPTTPHMHHMTSPHVSHDSPHASHDSPHVSHDSPTCIT